MRKVLYLVISLLIASYLFIPSPVLADNEFSTSYDVKYDVSPDATTEVTQTITLKNLTSKYYASQFTLTTGSTTLTDVSAASQRGPLDVTVDKKDNKTNLTVKFGDQIVGIGKSQTFSLKFKSNDFAESIGKTWEINLPKSPVTDNIDQYNLVLSVPISFGEPTSISPKPVSESQLGDKLLLNYKKDQLTKSGVSVNFGTDQLYEFLINYNLQNTTLTPTLTYVTLPPDTQYQDISINYLNPAPENVTIDQDGNYLAWYRLNRNTQLPVVIKGQAKLYINSKTKGLTLDSEKSSALTKSDTYWEKDNPLIKTALNEIFKDGQPQNTTDKVYKIYRYVVDTLKYDTNRVNSPDLERLGSVTALNNPNIAVCMEFTDLFISLTRAADIPARELDGFAYSQNTSLRPLSLSKDLLHAWPEYWDDKRGWVMVDPTWENTSGGVDYFNKFDLNHFVLAVKGHSSQTPYTTDEVKVNLSDATFKSDSNVDIEISKPELIWSGFVSKINVKVKNTGISILNPSSLEVITGLIDVVGPNTIQTAAIPPQGFINYQFPIKTPSLWETYHDTVTVEMEDKKFSQNIEIKPFILFAPTSYLAAGLVILIVAVYMAILILHLFKRKTLYHKSAN